MNKSMAEEIAELREMRVPELVERYEAVYGRTPRIKHREHLWRKVAWKIQEQRFGGLSGAAQKRLDELMNDVELPLARRQRGTLKPVDPPVGTTLTRTWKGTEIRATRVDDGWEHDGVVHRSLSALAKAVTGSHVSGPAFFGVKRKKP